MQLRSEGIDAHYFAVTDDIASAPLGEEAKRRGIAGDVTVFKCASAAAEDGLDLAGVVRVAKAANAATRTLGVAFDGCTLPGADKPLFTVPEGHMGLGLGIHGEPGVAEEAMPTAADLAKTLVDGVLADRQDASSQRIAVILNGLGRGEISARRTGADDRHRCLSTHAISSLDSFTPCRVVGGGGLFVSITFLAGLRYRRGYGSRLADA
jgi:dihydroxyacetone kinase